MSTATNMEVRASAAPLTGVSLGGVLRSEWIKLRSLRSVWFTMALAVGSMLFFGAINALDFNHTWDEATAAERAVMDPVASLMGGWFMAQLIVGVLGVLAVTSEYASGSIGSTLSAAPRRTPVLIAKLLVPALLTIAVLVPVTLLTFWGGSALLPEAARPSLADGEVLRSVLATPLCLGAVCAIGGAVGFALRSTAGAIGLLVTVLLVLPGMIAGFSESLYPYVPGGAIDSVLLIETADAELPLLSPAAGLAVLLAYTAGSIAIGAAVLRSRDA